MQDAWHRQPFQVFQCHTSTPSRQSMQTRRLHDVEGVRTVARHATVHPHLLQRHPSAVRSQHHRQRGCTTLRRLHLHDNSHPLSHPSPPFLDNTSKRCSSSATPLPHSHTISTMAKAASTAKAAYTHRLVTSIHFPIWSGEHGAVFTFFSNKCLIAVGSFCPQR